ncbi:MAG TPA: M14 metallopeptidase family protein [Gemmatimonadales bacterium]|nr:M14 metallopeptidase family protein [Gemmatimonadales bacterium]
MPNRLLAGLVAVLLLGAIASPAGAQGRITTPKEHFGANIGDDYFLATYSQLMAYWPKLDAESDRMVLQEIGKSAEGRPQLMAIITSPENHRNLARYKEISRRLALAEGLTDEQARVLAQEGKAVVWIDGGLHGTEVLGAHQLIEMVYQMVSRNDPETMRFLNDVVMLAVHANPDGMELVSSWYMRESDPLKRSMEGVPRLYQKYIGHDNNRDFYMVNQPETENMSRIQYHEWFPQIVYNHHQTGPQGVILFAPPFRDPFNYNLDPLLITQIDAVGAAMHTRFIAEGKPGATMRAGASYQTWWNGGLRTTTYFHNMIGLLTESKGHPTPIQIPFYPERQLPSGETPWPVEPQTWHFRQSIDYSITANRAVLDYASRNREHVLYNMYLMGKRSIERGSRDNWTTQPKRIDAVRAAVAADRSAQVGEERFPGFGREVPARFFRLLRDPALRDARGYIIPADQSDFPTAVKFVNTLVKNGITIHRATSAFTLAGRQYPAGSYVIKTAQAFRPHVVDMFEPQDYPNDFLYEGGPPIPPYDNAGYTLAFQMGVKFDRILDGFDGPFETTSGLQKPPAGNVAGADRAAGFLLSHEYVDAALAMNRLMAKRFEVQWLTEPFQSGGRTYPAGTIYVPAKGGLVPVLQQLATDLGVSFEGVPRAPDIGAMRMRPVRVGLWDRYGGSMPSGWIRWLLERYEFPFELVFAKGFDQGQLARKYDVLIFPTEAIPEEDRRTGAGGQPDSLAIPAEFRGWLGGVTVAKTVPQLKQFLNDGGTIISIGSSVALGHHAGLAIANHLVDASGKPLPEDKFYVPGSVMQVRVDNTRPVAYGVPERVDVFFDNSPVMKLLPEAAGQGVRSVAWFDSDAPLRSGWAWGQQHLKGGVAMAEARVGRGQLFLFGPEITNRGQPHGTFKFLFNGIFLAGAQPLRAPAAAGGSK